VLIKSYKSGYAPPPVGHIDKVSLPTPFGLADFGGGVQGSRKRSHNDAQDYGGRGDSHYARGDRQMKQMRRGGRGGRGDGFSSRGGRGGLQETRYQPPHAGSPPLPPGFSNTANMPVHQGLSFDPNDPMAAIMALQAMGGLPPLPGMPSLPQAGSPNGHHHFGGPTSPMTAGSGRRERCRDYDMQGYCARGDSCPYEHGTDRLIAPGQDGRH